MTNSSSTPVVPSEVGWQFVPQYYTFVNKQPNRLHCFYTKSSTFIHGTEGEDGKPCYGQQEIHNKITSIGFQDCKVFIHSVDAQSSANGGIIIQVIGEMSNHGEPWRKFVQTFFLAEQPNGYFVLNDIFRFLKEETVESDDASETAESEQQQPAPAAPVAVAAVPEPAVPTPPSPAPVPVAEPPREPTPPPVPTPAAAAPSPLPAAEEAPTTDIPEPPVQTPTPAPEPVAPAPTTAPTQPNGIHTPEPEKPVPAPAVEKSPAPTPAPAAAAPSPAPSAATPTPAPPAPAPAPTPAAPAAPRSWASLAASNPRKWGAAVAQESRGVTETPTAAAAPSSGTSTPPVAPAPTPRGPPHHHHPGGGAHPAYIAAQNVTIAQCFVKGVTEPISQTTLTNVLTQRFGPVKDVEIVRSKACAFLEFTSLDAAKRAIIASLPQSAGGDGGIWVDVGGEAGTVRISVETKKERGDRPVSRPRGGAPVVVNGRDQGDGGAGRGGREGGFRGRGGPGRGRGGPGGK
ncbi:putative G3BP-like protein [Hypsizygus marmoreus]|uniref:G3BP-like protein n=1 Tax=Hypsizygus marmoreus TaxID=39966 RepID=A0A369K7U1_HYPMA|nr:putative G3BP-like protein [Hypsizygus marmoreus]